MAYSRILWDNLIDGSAVAISASSEASDLPATNVAHPHRTKVWRTGTATASEYVRFDLGAAMAVQAAVIINHDLTGSDAVALQGGASAGATTVNQAMTYNAGAMFAVLSAEQTYQHWQIAITKPSAGVTRDVGRVFIGPMIQLISSPDIHAIRIEWQDETKRDRSLGGVAYSDLREKYRRVRIPLPFLEATEAEALDLAVQYVGIGIPFFIQLDPERKPNDWLFYVTFKTEPELKTIGWDEANSDFAYRADLDMNEET